MKQKDNVEKTVKGLQWTSLGQFVKYPFQLVFSIILANFISPGEFGLLGMVTVLIGLANIFFDFGFGSSLIRSKEISASLLNSIFWINILVSTFICLIFIALAFPVSIFYNEPKLQSITIALSGTFIFKALTVVPESLVTRDLNFKPLMLRDLLAFFISYIVSIILAYAGFGIWAVIVQQYVQVLVSAALLYKIVKWKPRFDFKFSVVRDHLGYGSNLTGFSLLNYSIRNLDNFLVGKFLGAEALGIYSRGYVFITFPVSQISRIFSKVMFPSLSKVNDDLESFRRLYTVTCQGIAVFIFPLMVLVGVTADEFVDLFLGSEWKQLVPIIQVFSFLGAYQAVGTTVGWIYTAQGRTDQMFRWSIYASIITAVSFIVGIYIGTPLAVAQSYAIANVVFIMIPSFIIPFRLINLSFGNFIGQLRNVLLVSLGMLLLCIGLKLLLNPYLSTLFLFLLVSAMGTLFYLIGIVLFRVPIVTDFAHRYNRRFPILKKIIRL